MFHITTGILGQDCIDAIDNNTGEDNTKQTLIMISQF